MAFAAAPALPADPTDLNAQALSDTIHARQISCREVMTAYLARIHRLNPAVLAVVNLRPDDTLLAEASACDAELAQGRSRGWLHGVPQAIKDTANAVGLPTTFGSQLLKDALPAHDSAYVARTKAAGAIVIGKTNMPELGLGSHSYNRLFGTTANPWDTQRSAGGSSGGAAVALALRLLPVADGSDFMGSLRNPAGWNHVFGLRPSQGRVPGWPKPDLWVAQLATDGPMARSVHDLARLLATQAGRDVRVPLSLDAPTDVLVPGPDAAEAGLRGLRVGWLGDLGGHLAFDDGILPVCEAALQRLTDAGAEVTPLPMAFNLDQLWQAWLVWRRALVAPSVAALLAAHPGARSQIKAEALWEHDQAQGLGFADFMAASQVRTAWYQHLAALMAPGTPGGYDLLALPVAQTWPLPIASTWPRQVGGRTMDSYHRWMEVTLYATFAGLPAISVPAGFDASGRWPMGLQLIGRPLGEAALLRAAAAYEARAAELLARRPPEPTAAG